MATQVIMPKLSPTMEEGQLARWLKKEGDKVSMGEPLAEIDTDKATMEMQALSNGVLRKILIKEGESAPLGQIIAIIGEPEEDISSLLKEVPQNQQKANGEKSRPQTATTTPTDTQAKPDGQGKQGAAVAMASPTDRVVVSPLAARMAAEAGVDLRGLNGTGPGGRIIKRDIEAAMSEAQAEPVSQQAGRHLRAVERRPQELPASFGATGYRDEPISEMRRTIARRLVTSIGPVPHFFLTTEIEMDRAADMRRDINALDPDLKLSFNDIIIKVVAAALLQHPQVNASFQERTIRYYEHADIGVAVAIEDGLITPQPPAAA